MSIWTQIKRAAKTKTWAKGNQLSNSVYSVYQDEEEWEFLVLEESEEYEIYLGIEKEEWDCSCSSRAKVCSHVCAIAVAFEANTIKQEEERQETVKICYSLLSSKQGLMLHRETDETPAKPIQGSIYERKDLLITEEDKYMQDQFRLVFGRNLYRSELINFLTYMIQNNKKIILDDKKVFPSLTQSGSVAVVEDVEGGFFVRLVRDPNIAEVYGQVALLYKVNKKRRELRLIGTNGLTHAQYTTFVRGMKYELYDVQRLVSRIIPELRKRVPVDIRTERLPKDHDIEPYLLVQTEAKSDSLLIHPKIVYGDPPIAEVFGSDITFLGKEVPIRDTKKEQEILDKALSILRIPIGVKSNFVAEEAVHRASVLSKMIQDHPDWKVEENALKRFRVVDAIEPKILVSSEEMNIDFGDVEPEKVFEAWHANRSMVSLNEGGWAPLPTDWLSEYGHLVADLLSAKRAAQGKMPKYALFDLVRLCQKLDQDVPDLGGLRMLVSDFAGIKDATMPSDLKADLREYQKVGVNWLSFLKEVGIGGILADDMGLGKTLQTLCILQKRSLVVVPTSVISNWKQEAEKFRPNLSVHIYHGTQRTYNTEADVVLTSYAILRNDLEKFQQEEWKVVVLDEAQAIKNPRSQTAQAAFALHAKFRVALTGTPIENRLEELWSQMHFLCPGFLSGIKNFRKQYEVPIANGDSGVAKRLRERIKPFVLRRLKKNVAKELPPRTNMTLRCTLTEDERILYDAVRAATHEQMVQALEEGKNFSVMSALEALLRMRQASCHSGLLPGKEAPTSSKVNLLIDRLLELTAAGHKALVFSQWTQLLNKIEPHLNKNNISFVRLDGSTKNRGEVVERFQSKEGPSIFLASLKAGGTGLNLTAADHVFLMDPWWDPAVTY